MPVVNRATNDNTVQVVAQLTGKGALASCVRSVDADQHTATGSKPQNQRGKIGEKRHPANDRARPGRQDAALASAATRRRFSRLEDSHYRRFVILDRQPVLESDLLVLRPLTHDDFNALYSIASDPLVWEQHPSKDRTQLSVFRCWFDEALASGGALVAVDKQDGETIGTSRFAFPADAPDTVEIGWTFLARARWGGTYNSEMKRLMLDHAFRSVETVVFTVHSLNFRSQRAVEGLGAVRMGVSADAHGRGENVTFTLRREAAGNRR